MRHTWTAGFCVAVLVATTGAAHAAADVSSADKAAIVKTINLVERPKDAAKTCANGFTSAYLKTVFGTKARCQANMNTDPASQPKSVTVSGISVSGSSAKATVKENGGPSAGATGTWKLTKSGSSWKVSGIDAKFFRSVYSVLLGPKYPSDGPAEDPLDSKTYRSCGLKKMQDRSDKAFLTLIYQLSSARNSEIGKAFAACTAKAPGGKSPFFKLIATAIKAQAAESGLSKTQGSCIVTKLRAAYSEPALINMIFDGAGAPTFDRYIERLESYTSQCAKGGSAGLRAPKTVPAPPVR